MDGLFEDLASKLQGKLSFNTNSKNLAISLESLSDIPLSRTFHNNYVGKIPFALSDFFKNYYEKIKTNQNITFNESDIDTSSYSSFFKLYKRIIEKLFFDYCIIKGLNFSDYELEKDIYFYHDFNNFSFDYSESMYVFYIVMFLSLDADAHVVDCDLFNDRRESIATGLPLITPHSPEIYLGLDSSVPAMIIKVKGV